MTATPTHDEHGWHVGTVEPWASAASYTVLSPESTSVFALERWAHQARRFFGTQLTGGPQKHYESGWPRFDSGTLELQEGESSPRHSVRIQTLPRDRASALLEQARIGVVQMGGAGFDVLVARTNRVWQFQCAEQHAPTSGSLLAAAIIASVALGPILAPDGALFGVKTARERLASRPR